MCDSFVFMSFLTNCPLKAHLPDERTSMVYGLGRVTGSPQTLDDGHSSRVVTVAVSDYVRDETRASTLQYVASTLFRYFSHLL
jgi:hypothetical protein